MAKRVEYFDIAKGIGMICIIMGHLGIGRVNSFVFTFHVPLFFLISGYFLNDHTGIREFVVKKTRQLIIPYIVTCICIIFGVTAWDIVKNNTFENVVYNVKTYTIASFFGSGTIEYTEPFYVKQIGAAWFLLALFFALLIVRTLMEYQFGGIAIFAIAYIGYKTTDILWLPFSIQAGMTASLFVYIGFLAKKYDVFAKKLSTAVLSITSAVWLWCIIYCGRLYMVRNYYENGLLDVLGALAGSYIVIILSKTLEKKTKWCAGILKFFGVNSLLLLCCHAFELNVVSWDWVWRLFSDRMHFQYYNVVIILICIKLIVFAVAIGIIKFLIRFFKNRQIGRIFIEGKNLLLDKKKTVETGRIKYWDMVKGFAIMLMILGHTDLPNYLRIIIFSFHMPVFVIVNGFFIKNYNIKRTFLRSAKSLLVPYVITCLISAVIYAAMGSGNANFWYLFEIKIKAMVGGMSKISTRFQSFESVWVVWFVVCLFLSRNIYVIIMKIFSKYGNHLRIGIIMILAMLGGLIGVRYAFLPWSLDVALVCLIFIMLGNWMRKSDFLSKNYWYTLVLPASIWIYFLQMGINIELATRSYPYGVFCVIEAIAGSITVISISKFLSRYSVITEMMSWIGKNSMLILCIHCLELMYFDWNYWVYSRLPFTVNWFRIFIIKSIVILFIVVVINSIQKLYLIGKQYLLFARK